MQVLKYGPRLLAHHLAVLDVDSRLGGPFVSQSPLVVVPHVVAPRPDDVNLLHGVL